MVVIKPANTQDYEQLLSAADYKALVEAEPQK